MYEQGNSPELQVLDAETATRVAAHFNLEVYGVGHGHTAEQLAAMFPDVDPSHFQSTATDEQRGITQALVDNLGPGDVLFREGYGYKKQPAETPVDPANAPTDEIRRLAKQSLAADQHKFDAISYGATHAIINGATHAIINGAHVMFADCNAEQEAVHEAASMGLTSGSDRMDEEREIAALTTMIDYAIDHLPPEDTPVPAPEERRRLMLLFGGSHTPRLKALAAAANLPITVHSAEETQRIVFTQLVLKYVAGSMHGLLGYLKV